MSQRQLTDGQVGQYHEDGYVLARGFFDPDEIALLGRAAREDHELDRRSFGRADGEGGTVRLSLWNHPGAGVYGMFARCERVVRSAEKLLGGEVYHYHSKMIMKDPRVGGAWAWHQDYGYWYQNGVLQPLLTSVFLAVDPCTRQNGCLQVIRGPQQPVPRLAPPALHAPGGRARRCDSGRRRQAVCRRRLRRRLAGGSKRCECPKPEPSALTAADASVERAVCHSTPFWTGSSW